MRWREFVAGLHTVLNLAAAKALGFSMPSSALLRADEVIEQSEIAF